MSFSSACVCLTPPKKIMNVFDKLSRIPRYLLKQNKAEQNYNYQVNNHIKLFPTESVLNQAGPNQYR